MLAKIVYISAILNGGITPSMKNWVKVVLIAAALGCVSSMSFAQEFNCDVTVNYESIPTSHRDYLTDFGDAVKRYINNYRWTNEDFGDQRISCTFNIFFLSVAGDNVYSAQVFIGSQRPTSGSDRSTGVVRIFDDKWTFVYTKNQPFYHNTSQFDALASFLDYYAYLLVGYDYDSFDSMAGTPYFQKALDIVRLGQSGSGARGWERAASGIYSRALLIDELLNAKFRTFRSDFYTYHAEGLDLFANEPEEAQENIAKVLENLVEFRKQLNERSLVLKIFFDTKYQEIAEVLKGYPDKSLFDRLGEVDPTHQNTYQDYKEKGP